MRLLVNAVPAMGEITGIGNYTLSLLQRLHGHSAITELGVFDGKRILPFAQWYRPEGQTAASSRMAWLKYQVRTRVPLARRLAEDARAALFTHAAGKGRWDVYHETNYVTRRFHGSTVVTVHDMSFMRFPDVMLPDRLAWLKKGFCRSIEQADRVICVSNFTRNELLTLCPWVDGKCVAVTHLGVGPAYHPGAEADESAVVQGLPERFILSGGAHEPRKNLSGLLRAYELLPATVRRDHPLVLAGPKPLTGAAKARELPSVQAPGRIQDIGYVSQEHMPALLRAATVLCFPSLYEGFGLPPLEAAACGTPVVCSNTTSLPEVMGEAAEYVDPADAESIAAGLQRVIEDSARRDALRRAGLRRVAQLTWEACVEKTVEVYRNAR